MHLNVDTIIHTQQRRDTNRQRYAHRQIEKNANSHIHTQKIHTHILTNTTFGGKKKNIKDFNLHFFSHKTTIPSFDKGRHRQ